MAQYFTTHALSRYRAFTKQYRSLRWSLQYFKCSSWSLPDRHMESSSKMCFVKKNRKTEKQVNIQLRHCMNELAALLRKFCDLKAISFNVAQDMPFKGSGFQKTLLTKFVKALPRSCVSLEIDSRGSEVSHGEKTHFCEAVCAILPRLIHLRLRLAQMCPRLLGFGDFTTGEHKSDLSLNGSPALKTLTINCNLLLTSNRCSVTQLCPDWVKAWYPSACPVPDSAVKDLSMVLILKSN